MPTEDMIDFGQCFASFTDNEGNKTELGEVKACDMDIRHIEMLLNNPTNEILKEPEVTASTYW